jgi:hypothetical protein
MNDWLKRRRTALWVPHPNSPASRIHEWSSAGVLHPNSPAGNLLDWSSAGIPHPNSPVGQNFNHVPKMTLRQRFEEVIRLAPNHMVPALAVQFRATITPAIIGFIAETLSRWEVTRGFVTADVVDGLEDIGDCVTTALRAQTRLDLARASDSLAQSVSILGVGAFVAFMDKIGAKFGAASDREKDAAAASAKAAKSATQPSRESAPKDRSDANKKQAAPAGPLAKWRAEKKDAIEKALATQRDMLEAKKKELKDWDDDAKSKFKRAFGTDDVEARDKISARIDRMLKVNKSMTVDNFKPADPSEPGQFAYVYPTDTSHTVYLDVEFDGAPDNGQDSKPGALAHEMSHFNDIGGTKDKFKDVNDDEAIYGVTLSRKLANDSPNIAINHADSFEYYVEDVP